MIYYNIVITEGKVIHSFLNLDKIEFFDKLWEWCYIDDLWDFLDDNPEYLTNSEELENYLLNIFIPEDLFHEYEYDDLNCFTFTVTDEKLNVKEFNTDQTISFVLNKIKEHYAI